jgi:hypothetical protein
VKRLSFFFIVLVATAVSALFALTWHREAKSATLIPVDLSPTTTLTAETSNNTSAYIGFPSWPDGNHAPGNVSKVDIHTLLYPGNTTKVFAVIEPWFCTNSAGAISQTPACNGHDENGYNENSTAQVTAQINDMMSRGIDGATCDFYGVGYDNKSTYQQQACDKFVQIAATKTNFSATMMEDDGSWKWRCDTTTTPTKWSQLGYSSVEKCVESLLEKDLLYFNKNYFQTPGYYTVNGRPVVVYFVTEANPMTPLGSAGWATLWTNVEAWAKNNGNPYFVYEKAVNSGSNYWNFADGAYGWPGPTSDPNDWQTGGYLPKFYNSLANDIAFAVHQGTAYKGFDDTLASWGSARIISQQCGQVWLNTFNEPTASGAFGTNHQLQGMMIATWNDYEEGTEIETGIDNCVSISSALSGNTLGWTVTGNKNTLDHYTVYISTDAQNLAVLASNITPSSGGLDLSQYNIPTGNYKLYVKAIGKPSMLNHMSNAVAYAAQGGSTPPPPSSSCIKETFVKGTVSVATTTPGGVYTITCDYGFTGSGIFPNVGSGNCTYLTFNGNAAMFNCTAGTATGTFTNSCAIQSWNTGNYCTVVNPIASITVITSSTASSTPPSQPQTTPPPQTPPPSSGGGGGGSSGGGGGSMGGSSGTGSGTDNNSSLAALLQSLLIQLQILINKLNAQLVITFTRNLTIGSSGQDVENLQVFLNDNGYPIATQGTGSPGSESDYFGKKTADALAKWQSANNLPSTGFFGNLTRQQMQTRYDSSSLGI